MCFVPTCYFCAFFPVELVLLKLCELSLFIVTYNYPNIIIYCEAQPCMWIMVSQTTNRKVMVSVEHFLIGMHAELKLLSQ